ncbi:MAG: dolichyl-phosphate-mannose--protein mannosyltransferase [Deltaproteobacteria bacterium]|jgi:4-amino-4-deoxy-L-arabinose transferase-like glycosyltransferase|nr:dolichyl-phosphate-mannose--protein mannosyltransferase [Deltaproteobacteria bacterium]
MNTPSDPPFAPPSPAKAQEEAPAPQDSPQNGEIRDAVGSLNEEAAAPLAPAPDLPEYAEAGDADHGLHEEEEAPFASAPDLPEYAEAGDTDRKPDKKKPAPVVAPASFFRARPLLTAEPDMPPSLGSKLFNILALSPLLVLTLLLAAQALPTLDPRPLWYSDEIRHAAVFQEVLNQGHWWLLQLNGELYPDKPPLYFWFLRGLHEAFLALPGEKPDLFLSAAALSGLFFLWATLFLGRFVARVDRRTQLASGLILLSSALVLGLLHYARMDFFFSALVLCSYAAFYHAWVRPQAAGSMILAFIFAALAVLTKGFLGLALPLAAGILFLCWRGSPLRLLRWDFLLGLMAALALLCAWAVPAALELGGYEAFARVYLEKQTLQRMINSFHHQGPWYYYLAALPLICLPWTMLFPVLPWSGLFSARTRAGLAASRRPEGEGLAYLWCIVLSALFLLSAVSAKTAIYFLPALPALSLISGRAVLRLSAARAAFFRHSLALLFLILGLAFGIASLMLFDLLPVPPLEGLPGWRLPLNVWFFIIAGALALIAFLLWLFLRSSRPEGVLLTVALCLAALSYPLATQVAPSFAEVLSPKAQALVMKDLADKDFKPVSFKDYGGTYTYYAGRNILESADLGEIRTLAAGGKIALAMPLKDWEAWTDKPAGCGEAHRQWLEMRQRVLLACEPGQPADGTDQSGAASGQTPQAAPEAVPSESAPTEDPATTPETAPRQAPSAEELSTAPEAAPRQTAAEALPAADEAATTEAAPTQELPAAAEAVPTATQAAPAQALPSAPPAMISNHEGYFRGLHEH